MHFQKTPAAWISKTFLVLQLLLIISSCAAQPLQQKQQFTRQDTLRGSITPERAWWNVDYYAISVTPNYTAKTIEGTNIIHFTVWDKKVEQPRMQIDLQAPMQLVTATWNNQTLKLTREGNVYWLQFPGTLPARSVQQVTLRFAGKPREAVRPPWDGGWIWSKDKQGRPWMSVACQGLGASVWYPCKDHQSDKPDSGASLSITVPDTLIAVGNGRLQSKKDNGNGNGTATFTWAVTNPINNYNIIPYIGKYTHWQEVFAGEQGNLDCDYWVLDYNLDAAKKQFQQVKPMLKCFEYWFGPYPFYKDGYKLVESPHLGMEHQSAVAYGNKFMNGYLGRDLSGTGWGEKWDFIIVHESGHEWFGNNVTSDDIADMWIHEGFTNYSETLFVTCEYGKQAGDEYCIGVRRTITNDMPVIGPYGVNQEGSGDMYAKGANFIHTLRQIIDNDSTFRDILHTLNNFPKPFHTTTAKVIEVFNKEAKKGDLSKLFQQYLRTTQIPVLEYKADAHSISFRWTNCVKGFDMPIKVNTGKTQWLRPTDQWQTIKLAGYDGKTFEADKNFYATVRRQS